MEEWEETYLEQLANASQAIRSAQEILIENGLDVRQPNVLVDRWSKIQIPIGHIRKVSEFTERYDLDSIIDDINLQKNIAYSLQTSDFINFIHNRFNVGLSVGSIFYKLSIINIFCVIEGMVYGIVADLNCHCKKENGSCEKHRLCQYFIKSNKKLKFNDVVDLLIIKQVLNLSPENRELLFKYNNMRNNVHIFINKDNEFLSEQYNRESYNKLVFLLRKISKNLRNNLEEFRNGREIHCIKNV